MIKKFEKPKIAVDVVLFTIINDDLKILLIKRRFKPFENIWALPGGLILKDEPLEQAAKRELEEETGIKDVYLEQLYTFGAPNRDPRARVISISYFALVSERPTLKPTTDAVEAAWFSVKKLPILAFDHRKIINYALKRLRWKLEYTNVAYNLLPKLFTLSELQKVYEIILGKKIDKRNFRKKISSLDLIESINRYRKNVSYRPPALYKFRKRQPVIFTKREIVF